MHWLKLGNELLKLFCNTSIATVVITIYIPVYIYIDLKF